MISLISFILPIISNSQYITFKFPFTKKSVSVALNFSKLMITKEMQLFASTIATSDSVILSYRIV